MFWLLYSAILENDIYSYEVHLSEMINYIVYCIALVVVTTPGGLKMAEMIALSEAINSLMTPADTSNSTTVSNNFEILRLLSLFC